MVHGLKAGALKQRGFSLIELLLSTVISLIILGAAVAVYQQALNMRLRQSSRTDAITSAQAALNIMSREIGNSGYGLNDNGVVLDSSATVLHIRSNVVNTGTNR